MGGAEETAAAAVGAGATKFVSNFNAFGSQLLTFGKTGVAAAQRAGAAAGEKWQEGTAEAWGKAAGAYILPLLSST